MGFNISGMIHLCFDIGNTLSKVAVFENDKMSDYHVLGEDGTDFIRGFLAEKDVDSVIISTVSHVPDDLLDMLQQKTDRIFTLDHNTLLPVENCYETKETLGKDRLAAVVGANYLYPGEDILVIDSGTAITYDLINSRGQYLGGNISPGIRLRFQSLNQFTSKLPLMEMQDKFPLCGTNTKDAILAGVLNGILYEADGTIDHFRQSYPDLKVLFTGGDAKFFDYKLKNAIFVVSNLVMIGLNRILVYNAQNL